jgi:hypothetical protein
MKSWPASAHAVLLAVWAGSLWTVAWVAPVLFASLDRVTAGNIAGQLFSLVAWIGMVCGVLLITLRTWLIPGARDWALWAVASMLALTLIGHLGVGAILAGLRAQAAPLSIAESPLRAQFGIWHGVSTVLYLIQAVIALLLVGRRR